MVDLHSNDLFAYPGGFPGWKRTDTSLAAAIDAQQTAATLREKAIRIFGEVGNTGLTAEELADRMGQARVSVQPRVSELRRLGKVKDSGVRRKNASSGKNAVVWVIATEEANG